MNKKMVNCKSCGAEIAKSAKVCPKCGAKQKKPVVLGIVLVIIGFILIAAAFGGSSDNDKPSRVADTSNPEGTASVSPEETDAEEDEPFTVGDAVSAKDIVVTLVDVSENNGGNYMTPSDGKVFVVCEFEIENNSDKDIAVSSIVSFEAYIDDYSTSMNLSAMLSSNKPQLDGSIASGKKMNGVIGYEADKGWKSIEVRFTPDFWSGNEFTFVYSK